MRQILYERMVLPGDIQSRILAACRNRAVCNRFSGADMSILFGLTETGGASEEEETAETGGLDVAWKLIHDEPVPKTVVLSAAVQDMISVPNVSRNIHAILFELWGELETAAAQLITYGFNVRNGAIDYAGISQGITTNNTQQTSLLYRAHIHLSGHWAAASGPHSPKRGGSMITINETTGGTLETSLTPASIAGALPLIGDIASPGLGLLGGTFAAPWRILGNVNVITNAPTIIVTRARAWVH